MERNVNFETHTVEGVVVVGDGGGEVCWLGQLGPCYLIRQVEDETGPTETERARERESGRGRQPREGE